MTEPQPIRLVLADDQELVRLGFRMVLDAQADMTVVAEVGNGQDAVRAVSAPAGCDVVLMDIRMPIMDGVEATRRIVASGAAAKVLVLTTFDLDEYVYEALRAGASGFLLKDVEPVELLRAVRVVAAGDALLAPRVTRRLILEFAARPGTSAPSSGVVDRLTEREREIVRLVAYGLSNLEIAGQLVISPLTVKTHVSRVLSKLGCRDRAQLVGLAYEHHLVRPGDRRQDG